MKKDKKQADAAPMPPSGRPKHPYIKVFFAAVLIYLISMIPILIFSGGVFYYTGDMYVQNIPMWRYFNQTFREGLPAWDWKSDLGMNFIGGYTFYGLFSPYTLLSLLVPYRAMPYALTFIVAVKMGVAALGGYLYCGQYVKKDDSAFICGILYAFSGWQLFDLVFHFSETVSFFPFLLYSLDKLVKERRTVCFAAAMMLTGLTNYYLFWGSCIFLLIYFIVKVVTKEYVITPRLFGRLAAETLIGTGLTVFALLPSFMSLLGNSRASNTIFSKNPLAYAEPGTILRIIESMFLLPDPCGEGIMFPGEQLDLASVSLYIPLFSITGVMYIFGKNRKSWYSAVIAVCAVFAAVPLFNSIFSGFNGLFYARWFYMPLLILVMMTGRFIDELETADIKRELTVTGIATGIFALYGLKIIITDKDYRYFVSFAVIYSLLALAVMYALVHPGQSTMLSPKNIKKIVCVFCAVPFLINSVTAASSQAWELCGLFRQECYNDFHEVKIDDDSNFRVMTSKKPYFDETLNWGYPSIFLFNSCIPGSETEFYEAAGHLREQNFAINKEYFVNMYPLFALLSVKYDLYFNMPMIGGIEIEPEHIIYYGKGFEQKDVNAHYVTYENINYIPIGFTYDHYFRMSKLDKKADEHGSLMDIDFSDETAENGSDKELGMNERCSLMVKALWLTDEQIDRFGDILTELPADEEEDTSYETFQKDCEKRRMTAAYEFTPDKHGFTSKIKLDKDDLVFYSVPYEKNFTAYVDGERTDIEKVFGGLSAVRVPAGDHTIRFEYTVFGLKEGIVVSVVSAAALAVYIIITVIGDRKRKKAAPNVNG